MKTKAFWTSKTNIVALIPVALAVLSAVQAGGTWQTIALAATGPVMVLLRSLTNSPIVWKFVVDILQTAAISANEDGENTPASGTDTRKIRRPS
jgi:hypothetical protein